MSHRCHRLVLAALAMLGAVAALTTFAPGIAGAASLPSRPDSYPWLLDGNVYALARSQNTVYLGGDFRYLGPRLPGLASMNAAGAPDLSFPTVSHGFVDTVVPDGDGGWYVGGSFDGIGGVRRSSLAHVLSDGTVDPAFTADVASEGTAGEVRALVRVGSTLYVAGSFTAAGGQPRSDLAAVDATTGSLVGSFDPDPDNDVLALAASGSKLYVGGTFSTIAGQARTGLAAFDTVTRRLDAWAPALSKPNVSAFAVSPTTLYIAGDFTQVGAASRSCLAAFDLASGSLTSWAPAADGPMSRLSYAAVTDTVWASGNAHWIAGQFTNVLGLDAQTGASVPGPWTAGPATATVAGNTLYVAADFYAWTSSGIDRQTLLVGTDLVTGEQVFRARLPDSNDSGGGWVRSIAVQNGVVAAGGTFESIGGLSRERLAAVDLATGEPTGWDPGADAPVRALAVAGDKVIAGGDFTRAGGAPRSRIAMLDSGAGTATSWNPSIAGAGAGAGVRALLVDGPRVYAGGSFSSVGTEARDGAAAIDLQTGEADAWAPAVTGGAVLAIARRDGTTFLGGSFTAVGGRPLAQLAAVDDSGQPIGGWSFDANAGAEVRALLLDGGKLFLGGQFTAIDGQARLDLAAVDPDTGALDSWDAHFSTGIAVNALASSSGELFAGGALSPDFWDSDQAIFARLRESDATIVQEMAAVDSAIDALLAGSSSVLRCSKLVFTINSGGTGFCRGGR